MANWESLAKGDSCYGQMAEKYGRPRRHKLLALDGGGIRGVLTLAVLAELESQLKTATRGDEQFRLGDYFDYIGGTSTGAIIAACLVYGFSVSRIAELYDELGKKMFKKPWNPVTRLWYTYKSEPLEEQLRQIFGKDDDGGDVTLGSGRLRCLLLAVMRNVTTDSVWPVSSNPFARYNLGEKADCAKGDSNLCIPLWQVVRASTAAPTFFSPQQIEVKSRGRGKTFAFAKTEASRPITTRPSSSTGWRRCPPTTWAGRPARTTCCSSRWERARPRSSTTTSARDSSSATRSSCRAR